MKRMMLVLVALLMFSCGDVQNLKYQSKGDKESSKQTKKQSWAEKLVDGEKEGEKKTRSNPFENEKQVSSTSEIDLDVDEEKVTKVSSEEVDKAEDSLVMEEESKASLEKEKKEVVSKVVTIEDFKIDSSKEEDGYYYTYSYTEDKHKVILALNSYKRLMEAIKDKPKALIVSKADERVVQDLILDRKYTYLLQVPIFSYQSLGVSLQNVYSDQGQKELQGFSEFISFVKSYSSYTKAYKSKEFWEKVEELSSSSEHCINYKILLSWRKNTAPKVYSFVTSFEKLKEFNEYFDSLFVFENGSLKEYKFEEFETYKQVKKKVDYLRAFRSRLDKGTHGVIKYISSYGELVMRYDVQYGRLEKLNFDIERINDGKRSASRNEISRLNGKYKSIVRLLDDMSPDISKMNKGMDKYINKYVSRLNRRNDG